MSAAIPSPVDETPSAVASAPQPPSASQLSPVIATAAGSDVMASVVNVASVKTHVPITLDANGSNHSQWSTLFTVFVGKYGLMSFIHGTADPNLDDLHRRQDYVVHSWIYGSISEEIFEIIVEPTQTARQAWIAIDDLFRDNKESRAVFLEAEFRSIVQGDMTVSNYCRKLKKIADALREVGHPVSDKALVLNTLRGLSPRFSATAQLIPLLEPFPSFLRCRSILTMAETKAANESSVAAATALITESSQALGGGSGGGSQQGKFSNGGKKWKHNKKSGGNSSGGHGGTWRAPAPGGNGGNWRSPAPGNGPWFCFNPWAGPPPSYAPFWGAPWRNGSPGILGSRPMGQPQAYAAALPAPPAAHHFDAAPISWDSAGLVAALNAMTMQPNAASSGDWVMDSGASSHMSSNAGSPHQDRDSSLQ